VWFKHRKPHWKTSKNFRAKAEAGDAKAQIRMAVAYSVGNGVWENQAEAVRWYRMAAEQGSAEGQYCLAGRYASGNGILQDYAQALYWTSLAAVNSGPPPGVTAENAQVLGSSAARHLTAEQRAAVRLMLAKIAPEALDLPWLRQ
jgi:TPR repeat protein